MKVPRMRFQEIRPILLAEVAMNPNSLRQLASRINATAGMEFEMYVPGAARVDDDYDNDIAQETRRNLIVNTTE